jgi:hypothetical protein
VNRSNLPPVIPGKSPFKMATVYPDMVQIFEQMTFATSVISCPENGRYESNAGRRLGSATHYQVDLTDTTDQVRLSGLLDT